MVLDLTHFHRLTPHTQPVRLEHMLADIFIAIDKGHIQLELLIKISRAKALICTEECSPMLGRPVV